MPVVALGDERVAPLAVQVDVEEDDVDVVGFHCGSGTRQRVGLEDLMSLELEVDPAEQPDRRLVVNDEDPRRGRMPLGVVHRTNISVKGRSVTEAPGPPLTS